MKLFLVALLLFAFLVPARFSAAGEEDAAVFELTDMLRVVEDKDGHVNVREKPSADSKVIGKVVTGGVVAVSGEPENTGDWSPVFTDVGKDGVAFIHGSRLKSVKTWAQAAGKEEGKAAAAALGGFKIRVAEGEFKAAEHKLGRKEGLLETIDGHEVHGTDGEVPSRTLTLSATLDGKPVTLPAEATRDLYQPNLDSLIVLAPAGKQGQALVAMMNSDGAGAYCVVWAFSGGKYAGRTVFLPF